jgi:hypothetical protein
MIPVVVMILAVLLVILLVYVAVRYTATNEMEDGILALILNNVNFANIGDATGLRGSTTAGSYYLSLHTADPGEGGSQTTSEVTYTSYGRVALARDGTKWTVSGGATGVLSAFPPGTGGSGIATHWGLGTANAGAGHLHFSGPITPNITTGSGVTPQLTPSIGAD